MNRIFKITLFLSLISLCSFAQTTILNGGFENWSGSGSSIVPQYWNSNKNGSTFAQLGPQTCYQSSTAHSGSYSAQIKSGSALGNVVNGSLTTGYVDAPNTTKADGYIWSEGAPYTSGFAMQFIGRPDSLVFWYQYTPSGSDSASVQARLHVGNCYNPETPAGGNHPDSTVNIIARALWTSGTGTVSTWTRVSIPFVYVNGNTPQYILVSATSSASNVGGTSGSSMLLDDIAVIYNPTIVSGTITTGPYYVSATSGAAISLPFTLTGTYNTGNTITAQLSNASGLFASPVNIGSVTTGVTGTINGTIAANTATGAGYKIRFVSSNPVVTSDTVSNVSVILTSTSAAPSTTQNIAATTNGTTLTVTETPTATTRQWESATTSGGPYSSITGQTATTYIPTFSSAGTYYVVCISTYPGGLNDTSNQVQINVVQNSIAPTSSQSILTNVNGNVLTVTETPAATSRQWEYATAPGGPFQDFVSSQTGTTYTPDFASAGTYYVVCVSLIDGVSDTSNEVLISVGSATLTTGTITGSPFLFSPHAPNASVTVPYTTSGTFNSGNVFTAQLSDATGSFNTPVTIGTVTATSSGNISATIVNTTTSGTAYRIRVISSNPVVLGSDNGVDLIVNQFSNSIAPTTTQTLPLNTNGTAITVTNSQTATQNWEYSTTSGSGYISFNTPVTTASYTPNFASPGTYYVVCVSNNSYDSVTSNEVQINVLNGDTIITLAVSGSPYNVSASAHDTVNVNFTSTAVFTSGNIFTAQLSDNTGSFATPVSIGTLSADTIGTITALIPDNSVAGSAYRIRVISSTPAITGSDNGTNLTIIPFTINVAPLDTQRFPVNGQGNLLTATSSQTVASYLWQYSVTGLPIDFSDFSPSQTASTYLPSFADTGLYYINCTITNQIGDSYVSQNVIAIVENPSGIAGVPAGMVKVYWSNNDFVADLTTSALQSPILELTDIAGQQVTVTKLNSATVNRIATHLPAGIYVFRIFDSKNSYTGKAGKN